MSEVQYKRPYVINEDIPTQMAEKALTIWESSYIKYTLFNLLYSGIVTNN